MSATVERSVRGPSEMRRLGARLGQVVAAGDVVALVGELGAGKTCFVQGLALGLAVPPGTRIPSPTFNIVLEHQGRLLLHHLDLYRIASPGELAEIGVEQLLFGDGVCAVEWIDRFPELLPANYLELKLSIAGPRTRALLATPHGPRGQALLQAWLAPKRRGAKT